MFETEKQASTPTIWPVGLLCHAVAQALDLKFNPVAVRGEISGFSRASSGHCYFSIKDAQGQIRCAMFRRAASALDFEPVDGDQVELSGRLGVYESRGDLQLVVEGMRRAGQGALFERFLRLKAQLQAQGLFDAGRKRALPPLPRGIGVVTSTGAAALQDVLTALARRVPHIPVVLSPAAVQGSEAPAELVRALQAIYKYAKTPNETPVDVVLLVRGGGSMEDLWAFNDEMLARTILQSPVPVISGVGHETDFTIADFVADLRAPTPTAAAELVAQPREVWLGALSLLAEQMNRAVLGRMDAAGQRLDRVIQRLGRPAVRIMQEQVMLDTKSRRLQQGAQKQLERFQTQGQQIQSALQTALRERNRCEQLHLERADTRLQLLDPRLVLRRGYAWLTDEYGKTVTQATTLRTGQPLRATLKDGEVDLTVSHRRLI